MAPVNLDPQVMKLPMKIWAFLEHDPYLDFLVNGEPSNPGSRDLVRAEVIRAFESEFEGKTLHSPKASEHVTTNS